MAQYGLEVAPDKTKTIRFGRNGGPYNGRFDFLGFEYRWEPDRKGRPTVKRRTARKKLQGAVKRMGEWLRTHRHRKLPALTKTLAAKLRGHWNYYGVIGNILGGRLFQGAGIRRGSPRGVWAGFSSAVGRFDGLSVVPREPAGRSLGHCLGVLLQGHEVIEGVDSVELARVD